MNKDITWNSEAVSHDGAPPIVWNSKAVSHDGAPPIVWNSKAEVL